MLKQNTDVSMTGVGAILWAVVLFSLCCGVMRMGIADEGPQTAWGAPELQGIWTTATSTPLERPEQYADRRFLTDSEVAELGQGVQDRFGDGGTEGWFDLGLEPLPGHPSSMIVKPADGRIPWRADVKARNHVEPGPAGLGPYLHYLDFDTGERCISDGITMFPQHPYNNNFRILQTPDHVVILQEMFGEVRIVPLDGLPHIESSLGQWLGDARGHWEGQTLVIETRGYAAKGDYHWAVPWRSVRPTLRLTERLTRLDDTTIDYRFTITDPTMFTEPWTAVLPMTNDHESRGVTGGRIYEFACHEGNYSLPHILKAHHSERSSPTLD